MTDEELSAVVEKQLRDEAKRKDDFIHGETAFLALIPLLYGLAIFWWGGALWNPNGVHEAALGLPYAPESWGALFVILGGGVMITALRHWKVALVTLLLTSAVVFGMFAVIVMMSSAYPRTVGQAILYAGLALLWLNRAKLAWES